MSERIPKVKGQEASLSQQKEQFSYWALLGGDSLKNVAQRKKALLKIQEMGWETFEDFKINGIKIDTIAKGSRLKKDRWEHYSLAGLADPKKVETIEGQINLSGPLFGDKQTYDWEVILKEETLRNYSSFSLEVILVDKKRKTATYESAEEIIAPIEINIKQNQMDVDVDFPNVRSLGQAALRRAIPGIFKEIKKYVLEKCQPEEAIKTEIANLEFKMDTEISREIDEDKERAIIKGLKNRQFDESIFYHNQGAAQFLEILKSPEYKLANLELELIKKHLPEIAPYLKGTIVHDLGAANALKAMPLLAKQLEGQKQVDYVPIDINPAFVFAAAEQINNPRVNIGGIIIDFTKPLKGKLSNKPKLLTLLGGTLGNGDTDWQQNLLQNLSQAMTIDDALILGVHLKSDWQETLKLYQNPAGREFVMATVRSLGFPEDKVELEMVADEENRQIKQVIHIKENLIVKRGVTEIPFKAGEAITIFVSQKYEVGELEKLAPGAGLQIEKTFLDAKKQWELAVLKKSN
jgi:L-histidine Nalpha-methyltransferase